MFKETYIMFVLGAVLSCSSHGYAQQVVLAAPHGQFTEHWYENLGRHSIWKEASHEVVGFSNGEPLCFHRSEAMTDVTPDLVSVFAREI